METTTIDSESNMIQLKNELNTLQTSIKTNLNTVTSNPPDGNVYLQAIKDIQSQYNEHVDQLKKLNKLQKSANEDMTTADELNQIFQDADLSDHAKQLLKLPIIPAPDIVPPIDNQNVGIQQNVEAPKAQTDLAAQLRQLTALMTDFKSKYALDQIRIQQQIEQRINSRPSQLISRSQSPPKPPAKPATLPVHVPISIPTKDSFFARVDTTFIPTLPLTSTTEHIPLPKALTTDESLSFHPKQILKNILFTPTYPRTASNIEYQRDQILHYFSNADLVSKFGTLVEKDSTPDGLKWNVQNLKFFLQTNKAPPVEPSSSRPFDLARYKASQVNPGVSNHAHSEYHPQQLLNFTLPGYHQERLLPNPLTHLLPPKEKYIEYVKLHQAQGAKLFPHEASKTPPAPYYEPLQHTQNERDPISHEVEVYHEPNRSFGGRLLGYAGLFKDKESTENTLMRPQIYNQVRLLEAHGFTVLPRTTIEREILADHEKMKSEIIVALITALTQMSAQLSMTNLTPTQREQLTTTNQFMDIILNFLETDARIKLLIKDNKEIPNCMKTLILNKNKLFTSQTPKKKDDLTLRNCKYIKDLENCDVKTRKRLNTKVTIPTKAHTFASVPTESLKYIPRKPFSTRATDLLHIPTVSSADLDKLPTDVTYLSSTKPHKENEPQNERACAVLGCTGTNCSFGHHKKRPALRYGRLSDSKGVPFKVALLQ